MPRLSDALTRFCLFASTFEPGQADDETGFSREDMDLLIETINAVADDVVAREPD